jgi:hypothetical protein
MFKKLTCALAVLAVMAMSLSFAHAAVLDVGLKEPVKVADVLVTAALDVTANDVLDLQTADLLAAVTVNNEPLRLYQDRVQLTAGNDAVMVYGLAYTGVDRLTARTGLRF